jgi:hypothetical protein
LLSSAHWISDKAPKNCPFLAQILLQRIPKSTASRIEMKAFLGVPNLEVGAWRRPTLRFAQRNLATKSTNSQMAAALRLRASHCSRR